jgi:hypothetical protein
MSNFFDNLIARSYNLKPVARPRLASRFEPRPGSLNLNQSQTPAPETEEFERTSHAPAMNTTRIEGAPAPLPEQSFNNSHAAKTEPPHSTQERDSLTARPHQTEWQEPHASTTQRDANSLPLNERGAEAGAFASTQNLSSFDSQSSVEPPAHETRRARPVASGRSIVEGEAGAASINQATELEREADLHESGGEHSREGQGSQDYRASVQAQSSAHVPAGNQRSDEGAGRRIVPAKVATRSNVKEGTAAPALVESSSLETPADAPVIRVSIGRIDVRAVMTDSRGTRAPAPPARQAPQALSLEEYLKQRNGGGR